MTLTPHPEHEQKRLAELRRYHILDTPTEQEFDDLTRLASVICQTPISLVTLIDADRQWFKSSVGTAVKSTPRDVAFCGHTILGSDALIIPDARGDPRFFDNPLVTGPLQVRFYAGVPLITPAGHALGALCVIDQVPRTLSDVQTQALQALSRQVVGQLQLRRTLGELAASERFARNTVDALTTRIAVLDESGKIIGTNQAWRADPCALGALGENYAAEYRSMPEGDKITRGISNVLDGRRTFFTMEYSDCRTEGSARWSVVRASRFGVESSDVRVVVSHEDITDRRAATEKLRHDSRHDALTGLPNRMLFSERVERCICLSQRGDYKFAVLFLDLDRFKIINDSLGHAAGDKLLTTVAERIQRTLRPANTLAVAHDKQPMEQTVARMGGDEFTMLLEHLSEPEDAARVAERVLAAVCQPILFDGHELTITASIGIVASGRGQKYDAAKDLLRDADAAMYKAKAAGKDRYVLFDQVMHEEVVTRMKLEADLRRAVERDEFELHYQPIVSVSPQRVVGVEALIRWRRGGVLVSPAAFIPIAEDTGMIVSIGAWVLGEACRQLAQWCASGLHSPDLYMHANVSRRQLADQGFIKTVETVLSETKIPPSCLALEITESAIMDGPDAAEQMLTRLKRQTGVKISVDDFGTGYSSLSCLQRFPIDLIKIDRAFARDMVSDPRHAAVMRTIVTLAHDLDMTVVAEGIETAEQAAFLRGSRCDLAQGFLYSQPLPAAAAEAFIRGDFGANTAVSRAA